MPNNDIFLDGVGKFQQNSENAGAIKFGEFSQATINTGNIAVSALFTGTSVNSGTIGNFLPYATSVLVQSNSANWNAAYEAIGTSSSDVVTLVQSNSAQWDLAFAAADAFNTDPRLTDAREPLAHTQAINTIVGLEDALAALQSGGGQQGLPALSAIDILDFESAVSASIAAAAGNTIASLVDGLIPSSQLPSYVDEIIEHPGVENFPSVGESSKIYVATGSGRIYRWSGSTYVEIASPNIPVQSVAGMTGDVYLSVQDINNLDEALADKANVSDLINYVTTSDSRLTDARDPLTHAHVIADVTGLQTALDNKQAAGSYADVSHTHSTSDITGFDAAAASASPVQSVAGKTGSVTLETSDINGLDAALLAASQGSGGGGAISITSSDVSDFDSAVAALIPVQSVAGKTGAVTLDTSDISGLQTALDAKQAAGSYAASSHTHAIADVTGLQTALDAKQASGSYAAASHTHSTSDITGFSAAASSAAPVQSVAGKTGTVTLSTSDVAGLASMIASNGGDKYLTSSTSSATIDNSNGKTITVATGLAYTSQQDFAVVYNAANHMHCTVVSYNSGTGVLVFDVNSHTGSGTYSQWIVNVGGITSGVTSVAGRTGTVTLSTSDVSGLQSALDAKQASGSYATTTVTNALSSAIDGKQASGSYAAASHTHSTADITGFTAAVSAAVVLYTPAVSIPVTSVAGRTGAVVVSASDVYGFSAAADARITAAAGVSVASLVGGFVPSAQLPSYVDDVVEYSSYAALTAATGESGKIYVETTAKKIYRWSGSAYVEIAPSPGSTDSVTEGSTNLYFTNTRASAAAPVQSVAGKTGTVTLSSSDIQGLSAAVVLYTPAVSIPVTSVAGRTGAVTLSASDINGVGSLTTSWNTSYTTITANSASWNTVYATVASNSAAWSTSYTTANSNSATWNYNTTLLNANSATWSTSYTTVTANSAKWVAAYTTVNANSASWSNGSSTNFGAISATSISLSSSMLSTYSTPVTASGDFLVLSVGNKQRLIRIWDFI